jgi:hypothetical protein
MQIVPQSSAKFHSRNFAEAEANSGKIPSSAKFENSPSVDTLMLWRRCPVLQWGPQHPHDNLTTVQSRLTSRRQARWLERQYGSLVVNLAKPALRPAQGNLFPSLVRLPPRVAEYRGLTIKGQQRYNTVRKSLTDIKKTFNSMYLWQLCKKSNAFSIAQALSHSITKALKHQVRANTKSIAVATCGRDVCSRGCQNQV